MKNVYKEIDCRWDVRVVANGILHYIGIFAKLEDAKKAAEESAERLNGKAVIRYKKRMNSI